MPKEKKPVRKAAAAAAPYTKKKSAHHLIKKDNPLFQKGTKNFGIGRSVQPKRDLSRYVKWPKYVKLQRQKRILMQRLKVPPVINQFNHTLDKVTATALFKLLAKYRPEAKAEKKARLLDLAKAEKERRDALRKAKAEAKEGDKKAAPAEKAQLGPKPVVVKYGINHITTLIEKKKAKLVVIAHDVDPIEIVLWLPALCRKLDVPYCIVKSKSRLGQVVRKKTCTALAVTQVKKEDQNEFIQLLSAVKENFNDKFDEVRKQWGGGRLGPKSQAAKTKKARLVAKEEASRAKGAALVTH